MNLIKGNSVLAVVLERQMSQKGISEIEAVKNTAQNLYGNSDEKSVGAIYAVLNYNDVGKKRVMNTVRAAGGTEEEVIKAGLVVSSKEFKEGKERLDALRLKLIDEKMADFNKSYDTEDYTPFYDSQYARADELYEAYIEEQNKKSAKKAETKVEAAESIPAETPQIQDDPFDAQ